MNPVWRARNEQDPTIGGYAADIRYDGLESSAARLRREIYQHDLEIINQHSERLNRETDEVIAYQVRL
jgi:hypothetical protein